MGREPSSRAPARARTVAVAERPARLPSDIVQAAASAATEHAVRREPKRVKDRIVARLKRLHPMD